MERKLKGLNEKASREFAFFPNYNIKENKKDISFKNYVSPVPREEANIEAEKGETMITPLGDQGLTKTIPKTYIIKGKKHSKGGTPLNVPDDTFLFSDFLKNKNEEVHKMFGKPYKKSGYTYAELSMPYMLNDDLDRLVNPHSDRLTVETSEKNIQNKIDKLSLLSVLQESEKGFKNQNGDFDLPKIVMPFVEKSGIDLASVADPFLKNVSPIQETPKFKTGGAFNSYEEGGSFNGSVFYDEESGSYYDESGAELELIPQMKYGATPTKKKTVKTSTRALKELTDEDRNSEAYKKFTKTDPEKGEKVYRMYMSVKEDIETNPELKKSIIDNARKAIENENNLGVGFRKNPKAISQLKGFLESDEDIIKGFLNLQEVNFALAANNIDVSKLSNPKGEGSSNKDFNEKLSELGYKPPTYKETVLGQTAYIGFVNATKDGKFKGLSPIYTGATDKGNVKEFGDQVSLIDGVWTNTTAGQGSVYNPYKETIEEDVPGEPGKDNTAKTEVSSTMTPVEDVSGWTAPDTMQLWGAANEIYADTPQQPWNAIPQAVTPNAYVQDPTNMAFNIRGQQAKAMDTVGSYTGLQGAVAASSGMTGAQDITSAIANVENQNVNVINQHEASNAAIINQQNQTEASLATNLHDKWAQLKDNMQARKAAAKQNFRNAYAQGWQNSVDIGLTNATSENYAITPWDGQVIMKQGKDVKPTKESASLWDQVQAVKEQYPDIDINTIAKYYTGQSGTVAKDEE
jgi:hypothetical protein